jgi:AhpD family alkylhydroperoxidase
MLRIVPVVLAAALSVASEPVVVAVPQAPTASQRPPSTRPIERAPRAGVSLDTLLGRARERVSATPRVELAPLPAETLKDLDALEPVTAERTPNYLRAFGLLPRAARPFAEAFKSYLYAGAIQPEIKAAMGLRMAQVNGSPYIAAHLLRILNGSERGRGLLKAIHAEELSALKPADGLALRYAEQLTSDIYGVSDEDFRAVRGYYNDGQVVELTMTVSFFNYFTRLVEAINLPVEPWALDSAYSPPATLFQAPPARVNLISDRQLEWAGTVAARRPAGSEPRSGFGLVNSQRAMMLSPDITSAWRAYTGSIGDNAVNREIKLHVSFAVSEANGCRYCTLHQVQGLRRLGVSMEKLMQMKKDDSALTPRELTAVEFARKLTRIPLAVSDADYQKLKTEFGPQGALEIVLQTCNFAFMNRFTDGLRLPSEDEAVKIYRETYGKDFERTKKSTKD